MEKPQRGERRFSPTLFGTEPHPGPQQPALNADLSRFRLTLRLTSNRLNHMQPAFSLRKPRPAPRPRIFSRPDRPRAMRAADAGIVLIMQRVVGHIMMMDVVP